MQVRLPKVPAPEEPADSEQAAIFEVRMLPYWAMLTLLAIALVTPFIVWSEWPDVEWEGIAVAAAVAGIVGYTQLRQLRKLVAVAISPRGFVAMDTFGERESVAWGDIERVTFLRIGWIRFLRVRSAQMSHWIPLEVNDATMLRDEVTRHAGRGHRLADALWRHLR
jgi:hypothetical protein